MDQLKQKREKLIRQLRTQKRQNCFSIKRSQNQQQHSLITLIPYLIEQQNIQLLDQVLNDVASEDSKQLIEALSSYINQKFCKLLTRKYYWNQISLIKKYQNLNHSYKLDKETLLFVTLLRVRLSLNIAQNRDIDLIQQIIKQDNQICKAQLFSSSLNQNLFLQHYKNMIKLVSQFNFYISSSQQQNLRQKWQNELARLLVHEIVVFPYMHNNLNLGQQMLFQLQTQFQQFQIHYLDILSKQSVDILSLSLGQNITTHSKLFLFQKIKQICIVAYHSFYIKKDSQIIRSIRVFKKLLSQITNKKNSMQGDPSLSEQYKNQNAIILNKLIQFFNSVFIQNPIQNQQDKISSYQWFIPKKIINRWNLSIQNQSAKRSEIQNYQGQNYNKTNYKCLIHYVLEEFNEIQYRILLQMLQFLASFFSYSDKFMFKMFQIQINSEQSNKQLPPYISPSLKFQYILCKLMKHISSQVRLNTFWIISNVSGSQLNYYLAFNFIKQIFLQDFFFWQKNNSLRQQLLIIVSNYLCNLRKLSQLSDFINFQLKQNKNMVNKKMDKQIRPRINMLEWIFQVLSQALTISKGANYNQHLVQRTLFSLYNLLNLSSEEQNNIVKVNIQRFQISTLVHELFNQIQAKQIQTLQMLQKIIELVDLQGT